MKKFITTAASLAMILVFIFGLLSQQPQLPTWFSTAAGLLALLVFSVLAFLLSLVRKL